MALGAKALCLIETGATLETIQAVTQRTSWMGAENPSSPPAALHLCFLSLKIFSGKSNKLYVVFKLFSIRVLLIFMFNYLLGCERAEVYI